MRGDSLPQAMPTFGKPLSSIAFCSPLGEANEQTLDTYLAWCSLAGRDSTGFADSEERYVSSRQCAETVYEEHGPANRWRSRISTKLHALPHRSRKLFSAYLWNSSQTHARPCRT